MGKWQDNRQFAGTDLTEKIVVELSRERMAPVSEKLKLVPRGNTCPGVNRAIMQHLISLGTDFSGDKILDVPCGQGIFLDAFREFFPDSITVGADIQIPPDSFSHDFFQWDASVGGLIEKQNSIKVITCISGVLEFDNTLSFFRHLNASLAADGLLIVSNDNLISVRDRVLYFFFARFRQYQLSIGDNHPSWKILTIQNLRRILNDAGFEIAKIEYIKPKLAEWLWLPLALPIFVIQNIYLRHAENSQNQNTIKSLFPLLSMISRHYIFICRPRSL